MHHGQILIRGSPGAHRPIRRIFTLICVGDRHTDRLIHAKNHRKWLLVFIGRDDSACRLSAGLRIRARVDVSSVKNGLIHIFSANIFLFAHLDIE